MSVALVYFLLVVNVINNCKTLWGHVRKSSLWMLVILLKKMTLSVYPCKKCCFSRTVCAAPVKCDACLSKMSIVVLKIYKIWVLRSGFDFSTTLVWVSVICPQHWCESPWIFASMNLIYSCINNITHFVGQHPTDLLFSLCSVLCEWFSGSFQRHWSPL